MQLLRAATLTTPDPSAAMACYATWFGYEPVEHGRISRETALAWGAPTVEGRAYAIGRPASGTPIFLRFVAGDPVPDYRPLRTYGWAAIELCVRDVASVHARLAGSPFKVIGPPRPLDGLPMIVPMQVEGPSGEIVYLTEIGADPPGCRLPRAASFVDSLFIAVLACSDLSLSLEWFERLDIRSGGEVDITYTMLARSFGLPIERKHRIATGLDEQDCFLEFDQYPPEATERPGRLGDLPPGVGIVSFLTRDIDRISGEWIAPPRVLDGVVYGGGRAGTLRAPDRTLVEIIEVA